MRTLVKLMSKIHLLCLFNLILTHFDNFQPERKRNFKGLLEPGGQKIKSMISKCG